MNGFGVLNEAFLPGGYSPARLARCLVQLRFQQGEFKQSRKPDR